MTEKPHLVDTHCHLNFDTYDEDRDEVVHRASENNVTRIIIPAVDVATANQALELSQHYSGVFAAVGVHPNSTSEFTHTLLKQIEELSYKPKVVAIGEIGLDYHWDKSPKMKQHESFEMQLELAAQRELPVIIHNRDADEDVLDILEQWVKDLPASLQSRPGVLHSFSAPKEIADRALSIGFYLGFTGPITFKKAEDLRRVARNIPLDRLLVETDAPFLTPHPHRGKRNSPAYVPFIADKLAALHNMTFEEMSKITTENAVRLFNLPTESA